MFVALVAAVAVLLTVYYFRRSPSNLPPGPTGIPILGYLPFLGEKSYKTLAGLSRTYGPVISVYLGSSLTLVLNDYQSLRTALQDMGNVFSGRPKEFTDRLDKKERKGVILAEGQHWAEHRKFSLSTFRNFGVGKSGIEPAILNEIHYFMEEVSKMAGEPFDISDLLSMSVSNNIGILEFGRRFEYSDPKFKRLLSMLTSAMREASGTKPDVFMPWIRAIPGMKKLLGFDQLKTGVDFLQEFMLNEIRGRNKAERGELESDYIRAYFIERERRKELGQDGMFDDETLALNLRLMFAAGTDTTSNTLLWALVYMMLHLDIQRKVQQEIDGVIGRERLPSFEDRSRMPYTDATIMEVQRKTTIVPLSVPHRTTDEATLNGFHIPKGTFVFPNLWAVHNDPKLYPDPESFRPERFINQDGKAVRPEYLVPFGIGKRLCLGEPLARMELFLYFTCMLQKFTFVKPDGAVITQEIVGTGVEGPAPFQLCAFPRN